MKEHKKNFGNVSMKRLFSILTIVFCTSQAHFFSRQEERWNWSKIPFLDVEFSGDFLIGTSESACQAEGEVTAQGKITQNSWTLWEKEEIIKNGVVQPRIPLDKRMGDACQRWTRYKEDVQLIKKLGMNAHRFSIEWSKIEPQKGFFDSDAMDHYIDYARELLLNGILPIPTLLHHTIPAWLVQAKAPRLAGFEDKQTIQDFVEYALYVLHAFQQAGILSEIPFWITINEPIAVPMSGYIYNTFPPGKKFRLRTAGIVAKNMLDAHIATYEAIKQVDPTIQVGFTHIMQPIQPYRPWNPLDQIPAKVFDYLVNDVALEYFKTGNFNWLWLVKDTNENAIKKLDFIGINYYTHTLISMFKERSRPDEKISDAYEGKKIKAMYPEGLYLSLQKAAELEVPIVITENGFAYDNVELRDEYIKKHLYVIYKALQEGIDIRGYLFWTLTDCFGWTSAHHSTHGIYKVNFETQERTLRPSAHYLIDVIARKNSSAHAEIACYHS